MNIKDCWCVREEENLDLIREKDVYFFTTGIDANYATQTLSDKCHIVGYVDNNRHGNYFHGKKIISLEEYQSIENSNKYLLMTCYRYGGEIIEQLESAGLSMGKDYAIWDDMNIFSQDENTKEYIELLKKCWGEKKVTDPKGTILVPYDSRHDLLSVPYAYSANYFAEKYNADIKAYIRFGASKKNISPSVKEIYKAFNVTEIIKAELTEKQQQEAEKITNQIWDQLYTWEDWNGIQVYNIFFGTTIVRHFLRMCVPDFELRSEYMYHFLENCIETIVYWYDYFDSHRIYAVILGDGVSWDGYIRDIAISKGIPTYALAYKMKKCFLNHVDSQGFEHFNEFWEQLTEEEKTYGLEWAKKKLHKRLHGCLDEIFHENKKGFVFGIDEKEERILEQNDKLKVMICPHIFEEDCYNCGEQIFDNNYFSWLTHLGELSNRLTNYDWYLKVHPYASKRDLMIFDKIIKKYSNIKLLPADISPWQLKKEGMQYALTVYGSVGFEYPLVGIQVINAGRNLQESFDFNWNPTSKEEYDDILFHLESLPEKEDEEGLYKFYAMNYLFYDWEYMDQTELFFENPMLGLPQDSLKAYDLKLGTWKYKEYVAEWTEEKHEKLWNDMESIFNTIDKWDPHTFYKKKYVEK